MNKRWRDRLLLRFGPLFAAMVIRCLWWLNRSEILGLDNLRQRWDQGEHLLFAFWHDQLLLLPKCYPEGPGVKILISASRDGELIARTVGFFGMGAVRGSSSRGGDRALREMLAVARQPVDLVITPDGPRGPRHVVKRGVAHLGKVTGRTIIPLSLVCSRGHRFGSWDRFLLPFPAGRLVCLFGEAVIPRPGEETGNLRLRLQEALEENERLARARLEEYGVSAV